MSGTRDTEIGKTWTLGSGGEREDQEDTLIPVLRKIRLLPLGHTARRK